MGVYTGQQMRIWVLSGLYLDILAGQKEGMIFETLIKNLKQTPLQISSFHCPCIRASLKLYIDNMSQKKALDQ